MNFGSEFPGLGGVNVNTRRALLDQYPEAAKDMIRATLLARRKLQDPQVFAEPLVKYLQMEPQDAQATAQFYADKNLWTLNGGMQPEIVQSNLDFLEQAGSLTPGLKPNDVVDAAFLNAVLDEVGRK